jgi:ADP-ribosylglycohydrolase
MIRLPWPLLDQEEHLNAGIMIGAIAGDIIGSVYERQNIKSKDFPLFSPESVFTDDTVLTVAVADCLLHKKSFTRTFQEYGRKFPDAGFGSSFYSWIFSSNPQPYNSWGNGSAMRVSPIGFLSKRLTEVLENAKSSAEVTHNHPEGIKGAQATAAAIFLARAGKSKGEIKTFITESFQYDVDRSLDQIRPDHSFDVSCQGTVPTAIIAFLESTNYEDAIRNAISLGGDSDTLACIAGGIAEAYYQEIPETIVWETKQRLDRDLLQIVELFEEEYA